MNFKPPPSYIIRNHTRNRTAESRGTNLKKECHGTISIYDRKRKNNDDRKTRPINENNEKSLFTCKLQTCNEKDNKFIKCELNDKNKSLTSKDYLNDYNTFIEPNDRRPIVQTYDTVLYKNHHYNNCTLSLPHLNRTQPLKKISTRKSSLVTKIDSKTQLATLNYKKIIKFLQNASPTNKVKLLQALRWVNIK